MAPLLALFLAAAPTTPDERVRKQVHQTVYTLGICYTQEAERALLAKIKEERSNAKIAGVVDLGVLRDLQDRVVTQRKLRRHFQSRLGELRLKALSCSAPTVQGLWICASSDGENEAACSKPGVPELVAAWESAKADAEQAMEGD